MSLTSKHEEKKTNQFLIQTLRSI